MPDLPGSFTTERVRMSLTSFRFHNGPKRNTGPYPERKYSALISSFLQSRNRLRARNGPCTWAPPATGQRGVPWSLLRHCNLDSKWFSSSISFVLFISQLTPWKIEVFYFFFLKEIRKGLISPSEQSYKQERLPCHALVTPAQKAATNAQLHFQVGEKEK